MNSCGCVIFFEICIYTLAVHGCYLESLSMKNWEISSNSGSVSFFCYVHKYSHFSFHLSSLPWMWRENTYHLFRDLPKTVSYKLFHIHGILIFLKSLVNFTIVSNMVLHTHPVLVRRMKSCPGEQIGPLAY